MGSSYRPSVYILDGPVDDDDDDDDGNDDDAEMM